MLDSLANIAQILGFGLQSYETLARNHHPEVGPVLASLYALAETSEAWKGLHSQYHAMSRDVQSVVEVTSEFRAGQREPKRPSDVAPSELKKLVYSGNLTHAAVTFGSDTRSYIRKIESALGNRNSEFNGLIENVRRSRYARVANSLVELAELRDDVILSHQQFLEFLSRLELMMKSPNWTQKEVRFFIDNRTLLHIQYPNVIVFTDRVLMELLDIFIDLSRAGTK